MKITHQFIRPDGGIYELITWVKHGTEILLFKNAIRWDDFKNNILFVGYGEYHLIDKMPLNQDEKDS